MRSPSRSFKPSKRCRAHVSPEVPRKSGASLDRRVRDRTLVFGVALIFALLLVRQGAKWASTRSRRSRFWLQARASRRRSSRPGRSRIARYRCARGRGGGRGGGRRPAWFFRLATLRIEPSSRRSSRCARRPACSLSTISVSRSSTTSARASRRSRITSIFGSTTRARSTSESSGYEGTYEADLLAYSADSGKSLESLAKTPMRDLYSLRDSNVGAQVARIEARREHFTPERFEQYRADARFFRSVMGTRHYLETLQDFGANATPFWMSLAHAMFSAIPPSNTAFTITGSFDVLLLLLTLVVIGRTFGLVAALVSAVVFGANDFVMYGTNWGGATLRHDWLFLPRARRVRAPQGALRSRWCPARRFHHDPRLPRARARRDWTCRRVA